MGHAIYRAAALAVLMLSLFAASAGASIEGDLAVADAAWPAHPCVGAVEVRWDAALSGRGHAGEAHLGAEHGCWITLNPARWAAMSPEARCLVVVHEVGHLAQPVGLAPELWHAAGGVMASDPALGSFAPCERAHVSARGRAMRALRHGLGPAWEPQCAYWQGASMTCRAWRGGTARRYRVTRRGDGFVIARLARS